MRTSVLSIIICAGLFFQVQAQNQQTISGNISSILSQLTENGNLKTNAFDSENSNIIHIQSTIKQALDHKNPEAGSFEQRFFVFHRGFDLPVVFVTEGYAASYAKNPKYREEISQLLNCNLVVAEHRFFGESVPEGIPWKYLTVEQAANDHHQLVLMLKNIYKGPWINTGISKGGQTAIYHRRFFPQDVKATVAYVAPFNSAAEDIKPIEFLSKVKDAKSRKKIKNFQREVLKHRDSIQKMMLSEIIEKNYTPVMSPDSTLDYLVLEFPFSFWQWCGDTADIPRAGSSSVALYKKLTRTVSVSSYTLPELSYYWPFHYQAYTEIGYYGFDTIALGDLIHIRGGYASNIVMAPPKIPMNFSPALTRSVIDFIQHKGNNIIYIYGENDPWSGSAAMPGKEVNALKFVLDDACHSVRIRNFDVETKNQILDQLYQWMVWKPAN
jgi:hypothetical protein